MVTGQSELTTDISLASYPVLRRPAAMPL